MNPEINLHVNLDPIRIGIGTNANQESFIENLERTYNINRDNSFFNKSMIDNLKVKNVLKVSDIKVNI